MRAEHTARRIATDQSGPVVVDHFASSARKASPAAPLPSVLSDHTTSISLQRYADASAGRPAV